MINTTKQYRNKSFSFLILMFIAASNTFGQSITFSELNYNSDSTINSGSWVELFNYGTTSIDLSGWYMKDANNANSFTFASGTSINAGERLVVVNDVAKFTALYPSVTNYIGQISFGFGNDGDQVRLFDNTATLRVFMQYTDSIPWPEAADGTGRTLELIDPNVLPNEPTNWFVGCMKGSPGTAFATCNDPLVFSEINYNSDSILNSGDWIELYNVSTNTINLTNYSFKDGGDNNIYFFPANKEIAPGGRLVLVHDVALFTARHPTVTNYVGPFIFNLSNDGELVRLFDSQGKLSFSIVYDDDGAWPQGADGDSYTLELLDPSGDMNNSTSWFDGCPEGSPGVEFDPDCPVGISEPVIGQLQISGNPAADMIQLSIPESLLENEMELLVYNSAGQLINQLPVLDNTTTIDISGYSTGLYIVMCRNSAYSLTAKFIVP